MILMGKFEARQGLTVVRRLWGQWAMSPSGVSDQSRLRINCPISLLPSRKLVVAVWTGVAGMGVGVAAFALNGTRGKKDRRRPVFPVGIACQYCLTSPRPMISGKVQSCACRAAA